MVVFGKNVVCGNRYLIPIIALVSKLGVSRQAVKIWMRDIHDWRKTGREGVIIRHYCLGWTQEKLAPRRGLKRNRVSEIIGNAISGISDNLLKQCWDIAYIAGCSPLPPASGLALNLTCLPE